MKPIVLYTIGDTEGNILYSEYFRVEPVYYLGKPSNDEDFDLYVFQSFEKAQEYLSSFKGSSYAKCVSFDLNLLKVIELVSV
jgi:hypothetical protein